MPCKRMVKSKLNAEGKLMFDRFILNFQAVLDGHCSVGSAVKIMCYDELNKTNCKRCPLFADPNCYVTDLFEHSYKEHEEYRWMGLEELLENLWPTCTVCYELTQDVIDVLKEVRNQ